MKSTCLSIGTILYIVEKYYHRIRKFDMITSILSTFAGTGAQGYNGDNIAATSATLNDPWGGITTDGSGNVYFADTGNNLVRMVNTSTNIITSVVGTGSGSYSGDNGPATAAGVSIPFDVALDSAGNIYIAVYGDLRIRKVNITTGIITTIAGNGEQPVQAYNVESNKDIGDGGAATSAMLFFPYGVVVDRNGTLLPTYYTLFS